MNSKKFKIPFFVSSFFIFSFSISLAQSAQNNKTPQMIQGCPYTFSKDLKFGDTDQDVIILQRILNSSKRTLVANTGVGSSGNETTYFGKATREALKRFQALYIEIIGVADGKFNYKTRLMAQSICNGDYIRNTNTTPTPTNPTTNEPQNIPSAVKKGPELIISSASQNFEAGQDFRITLESGKELQSITAESFIVDGGIVKEIRKLAKFQYLIIITPNENAKIITIQVEAEKVTDKENLVNENASNELVLSTSGIVSTSNTNENKSVFDTLSSLLNNIVSTKEATQICNGVQVAASYPCTQQSASAVSPTSAQQTPQNSMGGLGQILNGLMGSLGKGSGSGNSSDQQSSSRTPGGQYTSPGADSDQTKSGGDEKTALEKAKEEIKAKCTGDEEQALSQECLAAIKTRDDLQKCSEEKSKTDKEFRDILTSNRIAVNKAECARASDTSCTTLKGLPMKLTIALAQLKRDCKCNLMVTGGTEAGHGGGSQVFGSHTGGTSLDISSRPGADPRAAFASTCVAYNRPPFSERCTYKGMVFFMEQKGTANEHWHVNTAGYKCSE